MKKTLFLLICFICTLFLSSCNITVEDSSLLKAPDVEVTSTGIGIRLSILNDETEYINIYRKDVTDLDKTTDVQIVNIGMLFPKVIGSTSSSYFYEDINVYKNHKYQYYARYKDSDASYITDWSTVVKTSNGYSSDAKLSYDASNARFVFNEKNQSLRIKGTIKAPDITNFEKDYIPVISIKCGDVSQVFELGSLADGDDINLRGILSTDFMDKEIQILGILGQKKEYVEDSNATEIKSKQIKRLIWTLSESINMPGFTDGKIKVVSDSGTSGYDYS